MLNFGAVIHLLSYFLFVIHGEAAFFFSPGFPMSQARQGSLTAGHTVDGRDPANHLAYMKPCR